ncbi:MFS transporter [Mycobacterium heidelbergense]|uniref:MFS transporter n=1 Tax=Mycobacterium heidelbergense TaxID=53376 RepID=UPI003CF55864
MPAFPAPTAPAQPRVFGRLLSQGTFYNAGMQLSNGTVVLPFICAHQGLSWVAALLFPAFSLGDIVGNSVSPVVLQRVGLMRHRLLAVLVASVAALILCDAFVPWNGGLAAPVFLLTCAAAGVLLGITGVAYPDLISSKLSAAGRGELLLFQSAIGSVLATLVTLFVVPVLAHGDEMTYRRDLLWLGAAGLVVSAVAALSVGPVRSASNTTRTSARETYRQGFAVARSQPWFRRYVTACLLFAPVTLGTTFYALRTAHQNGSLHVLVILSSIGLVFGSPLWRKVFQLFGVRGMMLGSALLSITAATLTVVAESSGQWFHIWAYGTVFLLATVAGQAVFAAAISWLSAVADESHRATLIAFSSTLVAIEAMALAFVLGSIAQNHTAIWPDVVVLLLAVAAAIAALGAPKSETRPAPADRERTVAFAPRSFAKVAPAVSLQAA